MSTAYATLPTIIKTFCEKRGHDERLITRICESGIVPHFKHPTNDGLGVVFYKKQGVCDVIDYLLPYYAQNDYEQNMIFFKEDKSIEQGIE
jgi:hypothetical protein